MRSFYRIIDNIDVDNIPDKYKDKTIVEILGPIDALKLKSSMTLFDIVEPNSVFNDILNTFYEGEKDIKTLQLLEI